MKGVADLESISQHANTQEKLLPGNVSGQRDRANLQDLSSPGGHPLD